MLRAIILLSVVSNSSILPNSRIVHFHVLSLSALGSEVPCIL
jgi:hypothetical protein